MKELIKIYVRQSGWAPFKWSLFVDALRAMALRVLYGSTNMNALRAMALRVLYGSTEMNALRANVSRRERISVEKTTCHPLPAFARRASTKTIMGKAAERLFGN
jgi:hypothetical protein